MKLLLPLLTTLLAAAATASAALVEQFEYGGHTYQIYTDALTFQSATTAAANLTLNGVHGYLWNVNSAAENSAVFTRLQAWNSSFTSVAGDGGGARYIWLGASDAVTEGDWRWSDGNVQFWQGNGQTGGSVGGLYNNWGVGPATQEPDNYLGNQNAGAIALDAWPNAAPPAAQNAAGKWNDLTATDAMPYVVEFATVVPEPTASVLIVAAATVATATLRRRREPAR
jgi:hypothetical protein